MQVPTHAQFTLRDIKRDIVTGKSTIHRSWMPWQAMARMKPKKGTVNIVNISVYMYIYIIFIHILIIRYPMKRRYMFDGYMFKFNNHCSKESAARCHVAVNSLVGK